MQIMALLCRATLILSVLVNLWVESVSDVIPANTLFISAALLSSIACLSIACCEQFSR